ncbi:hypothetical protein EX30DRAFT_164471 [Ascodesmis nigricans]|uniref:Uncharacterized protein n=1 Tax=Ascodesmis nigricans TaxID=341454 RepID=A0A4S2MS19_9PEZI|nr:hypothetical protein EX30DRAFT_164471 [Ascodesmis nigricans]
MSPDSSRLHTSIPLYPRRRMRFAFLRETPSDILFTHLNTRSSIPHPPFPSIPGPCPRFQYHTQHNHHYSHNHHHHQQQYFPILRCGSPAP